MTFLAKTGGCTGGRRLGYGQLEEAESEEKSPLRSGVLAMGGVGVLYNSYEGKKKKMKRWTLCPNRLGGLIRERSSTWILSHQ